MSAPDQSANPVGTRQHRESIDARPESTDRATVLVELACTAERITRDARRRDELIAQALDLGASERVIGKAARLTGQAIHKRKEKRHG